MRDNNKLIADFMGKEWHKEFFKDVFIISPSNITYKFDTDWNWLMPVVEKIETTNNGCTLVIIEDERCHIDNQNGIEIDSVGHTKIEATYNAVIEFIKQYKP